MTSSRTAASPIALLCALALSGLTLAGCTPEPEPTPTAAFASEEEAFAAAEEVYRAYNDAGNSRRANEQSPDPQDYLTGTALEGDIDALNYLRSEGLRVEGSVSVLSFSGLEADIDAPQVTATVCLDASQTRVINDAGEDVTPVERTDVVAQIVTLVGSPDRLLISAEASADGAKC